MIDDAMNRLNFTRMQRLLHMDARKFGKLEPAEQRVLLAAAERLEKRFGEQVNMMKRHVTKAKTPWPLRAEDTGIG